MSGLLELMGVSPTAFPHWDRSRTNADQMPDWDAVQQRLITHPNESSQPWRFRGDQINADPSHDARTPMFPIDVSLRISFFPPPMSIIQTLIELCPSAISLQTLSSVCNTKPAAHQPNTATSPPAVAVFQMLLNHAPPEMLSFYSLIQQAELLHLAVKRGNLEIAVLLIRTFPQALSVMSCKGGLVTPSQASLPIHIAAYGHYEGYQPTMLPCLLKAGTQISLGGPSGTGGMFLPDSDGSSALDIAVRCNEIGYNSNSWDVLLALIEFAQEEDAAHQSRQQGSTRDFIISADGPPLAQTMLFSIQLEAVPLLLVERTILHKCTPEDLGRKDHYGYTPLVKAIYSFTTFHFLLKRKYERAAPATNVAVRRRQEEQQQEEGNDAAHRADNDPQGGRERGEYRQMHSSEVSSIIEKLHEQEAQSKILWQNIFEHLASPNLLIIEDDVKATFVRDNEGRLPIHIAAECHIKWDIGMEAIVKSNFEALGDKDPVTRLVPFMLAAVSGSPLPNNSPTFQPRSLECDLDTIFSLLRMQPYEVMVGGHTAC